MVSRCKSGTVFWNTILEDIVRIFDLFFLFDMDILKKNERIS